ncbi:MAG: ISAs1 family transposase [Candidatus Hydrothermarchaeota archaeon]
MKYIILPERLSHSPAFSVKPTPTVTLWHMLHKLPDPRRAQGTRHALPTLLMLGILAICSGEGSYEAMADWPRNYQDEIRKQVPFLAGHTPDKSTFHRVFARLDIAAVEEVLGTWIQDVVPLEEGEGIGLDGKAVGRSGYHLVAAFAHKARAVLFQEGTNSKGKELVAAPRVLKNIPVKGQIVTGDALFTQKNLCELITQKGGGFVFTAKDNQKTLAEDIRLYFAAAPCDGEIETHTTVDKHKGRVEVRKMEVTTELNEYIEWPGVTHVWRVRRERTEEGRTTTQTAVGIARLLEEKNPARQLNRRWGINPP